MSRPLDLRAHLRGSGGIISTCGALGTATLAVLAVLGTFWTGFQTWNAVQTGFVAQGLAVRQIQATLAMHGVKLDNLNTRLARIESHEPQRHATFISPDPALDLWTNRDITGISGGGTN
jgi:hypothetical protein